MWYIGAVLALFASIASNAGVNIQKYSFLEKAKNAKPGDPEISYWKDKKYVIGLAMVIFGSLFDFAALSFASLSIVAPIASTTLVANIFFAHYWLKENLTRIDLIGTALIILGATLAVAMGNHNEKDYTISELLNLYSGPLFLIYAVIIVSVSTFLYLFIRKVQPMKVKLVELGKKYDAAVSENNNSQAMEIDELISKAEIEYQPYEKYHPFSYCCLSGIFGGNSLLFSKMIAVCLSTTFKGSNQLINPFFYIFLPAMLYCIFSQLHFLALALAYFDALYCVPVFQCFFIVISTLGGAAYFLEFDEFTPLQASLFPVGILITVGGVYCLSAREMKKGRVPGVAGEKSLLDSDANSESVGLTILAGADSDIQSNPMMRRDTVDRVEWLMNKERERIESKFERERELSEMYDSVPDLGELSMRLRSPSMIHSLVPQVGLQNFFTAPTNGSIIANSSNSTDLFDSKSNSSSPPTSIRPTKSVIATLNTSNPTSAAASSANGNSSRRNSETKPAKAKSKSGKKSARPSIRIITAGALINENGEVIGFAMEDKIETVQVLNRDTINSPSETSPITNILENGIKKDNHNNFNSNQPNNIIVESKSKEFEINMNEEKTNNNSSATPKKKFTLLSNNNPLSLPTANSPLGSSPGHIPFAPSPPSHSPSIGEISESELALESANRKWKVRHSMVRRVIPLGIPTKQLKPSALAIALESPKASSLPPKLESHSSTDNLLANSDDTPISSDAAISPEIAVVVDSISINIDPNAAAAATPVSSPKSDNVHFRRFSSNYAQKRFASLIQRNSVIQSSFAPKSAENGSSNANDLASPASPHNGLVTPSSAADGKLIIPGSDGFSAFSFGGELLDPNGIMKAKSFGPRNSIMKAQFARFGGI